MQTGARSRTFSFLALLLAASVCAPAGAAVYTFSQTGFDGGGSISGSFAGDDLDANGQLSSFQGEITDYSVSFAGDALVPAFTHTLADLFALVFNLGEDGVLGNGGGLDPEGVMSVDAQFLYSSGLGPNGFVGGFVENIATGVSSATVSPAAVPAPGLLWLVAAGAGAMAVSRRRSRLARH